MKFLIENVLEVELTVINCFSQENYFDELMTDLNLPFNKDENRYVISQNLFDYWSDMCAHLNAIEARTQALIDTLEISHNGDTFKVATNQIETKIREVSKLTNLDEHIEDVNLMLDFLYTEYETTE